VREAKGLSIDSRKFTQDHWRAMNFECF
jgi:hypothetical protein